MAQKELLYSSSKLRTRLAARDEAGWLGDETLLQSGPAFLRRKSSEGRGRRP
jgi:hypothetical protein